MVDGRRTGCSHRPQTGPWDSPVDGAAFGDVASDAVAELAAVDVPPVPLALEYRYFGYLPPIHWTLEDDSASRNPLKRSRLAAFHGTAPIHRLV